MLQHHLLVKDWALSSSSYEPPCNNMILTLTGFKDRDMIIIARDTYTGYFTKHNHAVICKRPAGKKFENAREWKFPAVSMHWLNDVLFRSAIAAQSMNNPRYQQFKPEEPLRIDYSLVQHVAQIRLQLSYSRNDEPEYRNTLHSTFFPNPDMSS